MAPFLLALAACGGGGSSGGGADAPDSGTTPPPPQVTVSGTLSYDFVPQAPLGGLDFDATQRKPVIGVTVQALSSTGTILDTATSDTDGRYQLSVPQDRQLRVRALAQRRQVATDDGPGWNTAVRDNTTLGRPLYAMDSAFFTPGAAGATRDLHAASGWTGAAYTEPRVAAPFALLDGIRQAEELVLAQAPDLVFPPLTLLWSTLNTPSTRFRPSIGEVLTTFFDTNSGNTIYVLGDAAVDTDEYDLHVVVHEWGHYYETHFARVDSPGGAHLLSAALDPRVAFAEGWANAWAGMVLQEPMYTDTGRPTVERETLRLDLEQNDTALEGWFSQTTVGGLLWDIFDLPADGLDQVSQGFGPIDAVLRGPQRSTPAQTTLFSFLAYYKQQQPGTAAVLDAMAEARGVTSTGQDIWGSLERRDGGRPDALPVYLPLAPDGPPVTACTSAGPSSADVFNRLGTRRLLRVQVPAAGVYLFEAQGPAGSSPALNHWLQGEKTIASTAAQDSLRTLELDVPAGDQVLEVYDTRNLVAPPVGEVCFEVRARRVQ